MLQANIVEKFKIHILCSIIFSENRTVYDIVWKNMVEPYRPQMTYKTAHALCMLITKATDTHS
jgi:hypothetical protein